MTHLQFHIKSRDLSFALATLLRYIELNGLGPHERKYKCTMVSLQICLTNVLNDTQGYMALNYIIKPMHPKFFDR